MLFRSLELDPALCLVCEPKSLERSASFQSMGFDSLRAAELHLRLKMLTGLPLSITMLWNYPTIDELAGAIWNQMPEKQLTSPSTPIELARAKSAPTGLEAVLDEVEGLSDADLDGLFSQTQK